MTLGARVPRRMRRAARPVAEALRQLAARLRSLAVAATGRPRRGVRVSYGLARIPSRRHRPHGGVVKLQALEAAYPNSPYRFNVLYLVSSRLPTGAVRLATAAQRKGARLVVNQNGVAYPGWHGPGWERFNQPRAELLARADHVFYQSDFCRLSSERFLGTPAAASEILYNAVDTRTFVPASPRTARSGLTLLLGGTQEQWYRVDVALQTLAAMSRRGVRAEMIVTGRLQWVADERAALVAARARADECGVADRVRFTGPYSQAEAPSIFHGADLLLHTKYNDPCPTVVLEAMACGLPIVYSASGGVPELVGPDAGIGVPAPLRWDEPVAPDPELLASAVIEALDRRASLAAAARQRAVDHFDLEPWLRRHGDVFERLAH